MSLFRAVTGLTFLVTSSTYSITYSEKYALHFGKFWSHVSRVSGSPFRVLLIAKRCAWDEDFLYQINVILSISDYWLLQNLEKRKKSNTFNRLQIEVFSLPNVSSPSPNIGPSNFSFVCIYTHDVLKGFYGTLPCLIVEEGRIAGVGSDKGKTS